VYLLIIMNIILTYYQYKINNKSGQAIF